MSQGQVGPYQLVRELGRGGMGVVYEARHPNVPRPLALKRLLAGETEPVERARFLREAEMLARVRHRNVVVVHDLQTAPNGDPYLVTEFVQGEELGERLKRGPLDPREAARIVAALAGAVAAIHAEGILHRDLKPANVIMSPDDEPVLLDFGLARELHGDRLTQTGEMMGTPAYMAPEQAEGDPNLIDRRCDVYGLGAILYACLTGDQPYHGTLVEVLAKLLKDDPPWPRALRPDVPSGLDAVVRLAMQKTPQGRYATAEELGGDLERWLGGEAPSAVERAPEAPQAARWVALVVLLIVLAIGGGLAVAIQRLRPPPPTASYVPRPSVSVSVAPAFTPLPEGTLATGVLDEGGEGQAHFTWAEFLPGAPPRVVAVNQAECALRAWRVDVTPAQQLAPYSLPQHEGMDVSWVVTHPRLPRVALILKRLETVVMLGKERVRAKRIEVAVYELAGEEWSELWRADFGAELAEDRPLHEDGGGYLRLAFSPTGERLAHSLPFGRVVVHDATSGERLGHLDIPNREQEITLRGLDGHPVRMKALRWPTNTGGLCWTSETGVAVALHGPAELSQFYEPAFRIVSWKDYRAPEAMQEIQTPGLAATGLAHTGEEFALGFQAHLIGTLPVTAEQWTPEGLLPATDSPRRYRGQSDFAVQSNIGHPPRWLTYFRGGRGLIAGAGDYQHKTKKTDLADTDTKGIEDGGEVRWWIRGDDGRFAPGGVYSDDGPVPIGKRLISGLGLDASERYLVVARRGGYVQVLPFPPEEGK